MEQKHPLSPVTEETAKQKNQMAKTGRNLQNRKKISFAYSVNSEWINRNASFTFLSSN